jgi:enoyl-CoA hydratase
MLRPVGDTVGYELDGAVATLTLDRPQRLNAIIPALIEDLGAALDRAEADETCARSGSRAPVAASARATTSSGGAEHMEEAEAGRPWDPMADYRMMSRFVGAYMRLWRSPKPVIAQVHGHCVGGGTDFALCSDLIVCADDCRIGYPPAACGVADHRDVDLPVGLERSKRCC